jgi:hypothetical protein
VTGPPWRFNQFDIQGNDLHLANTYTYSAPNLAGSLDLVQKNPNEIDVFYPYTVNPTTIGIRKDRIHVTAQGDILDFNFVGRTNYPLLRDPDPWIFDVAFRPDAIVSNSTLNFFLGAANQDFVSKKGLPLAFNPTGPLHTVFNNPAGTTMTASCVSDEGDYAAEAYFDPVNGYFVQFCTLDHGTCDGAPLGSTIPLGPFTPVSDANAFNVRFDSIKIVDYTDSTPPYYLTIFPKQNPAGLLQLLNRRLNLTGHPSSAAKPFTILPLGACWGVVKRDGSIQNSAGGTD